jgi:hypothetical protein
LTTIWPGVTDLITSWPTARRRTLGDEVLHDRQRDVGLEQRQAHLAQRLVDVALGERAAAAQPVEDLAEALTQIVEHRTWTLRSHRSRPPKQKRPGGRNALTGGDLTASEAPGNAGPVVRVGPRGLSFPLSGRGSRGRGWSGQAKQGP